MFVNNGETLYYLNWLQNGIIQVKHVWNNHRFITLEELMRTHNISPNFRNMMAQQYRTIVNAIPPKFIQKLHELTDRVGENVSNFFNILDLYNVTKQSLSSQNVYQRLLFMKLNGFQLGYRVLENAGFDIDDLNLTNLQSWWLYLKKSELDNNMKEFQWRISHKALYTFIQLHDIDNDISRSCIFCKNTDETLEHVFVNCTEVRIFWDWIFRQFHFTTDLNNKFVYLNNFENMTSLTFLITILGKYTIWEMRGILRKAQLLNLANVLKVNFKYKLQSQLTTLYHRYKSRNTEILFETEYLVQNVIVLVNDNVIVNS